MQHIADTPLPEAIAGKLAQAIGDEFGDWPLKSGVEWKVRLDSLPGASVANIRVVADIKIDTDDSEARKRGFLLRLERAEWIDGRREAVRAAAAEMLKHTPAAAVAVVDAPSGIFAVEAEDHTHLTFPARTRSVAL